MNNKLYGRNSRATPKQFEKLLEIVSAPGILDLASGGHVAYRHLTKSEFWKQAASKLNSVPGGVYKNPFKWCKVCWVYLKLVIFVKDLPPGIFWSPAWVYLITLL